MPDITPAPDPTDEARWARWADACQRWADARVRRGDGEREQRDRRDGRR